MQIGRLQARSSGWVPAFELDDVVLRDGQGREALRLPKLAVALSVPALLAGQLRLQQLLVDLLQDCLQQSPGLCLPRRPESFSRRDCVRLSAANRLLHRIP